jgi:hypothetical protein
MKLTDQEQVILKAIGNGVAEVSRVIKAVGYPKATVKKVLVRLSEKGVVALHRHDWPASLKPEQRKLMVKIGSNYYSAVSVMRRNPKQSKGKTALKTTGRALKGLAKGALSAGAQILGAGAMALNPTKKRKKATKKNKTIIKAKRVLIKRVCNPRKKSSAGKIVKARAKKAAVKRKRNLDHRDSKHQVEVSRHWRAGGLSQWQRAHKAGQHDLFAHGIKARNPKKGAPAGSSKWIVEQAGKAKRRGWSTETTIKEIVNHLALTGGNRAEIERFVRPYVEKAYGKKTRNASRTVTAAKTAKRRARSSSQGGRKVIKARSKKIAVKRNASPTARAKSSIRSRKAPTRRASKRTVKKSSRVGKRRNPTPAVLAVVNPKSKAAQNRKEFAGEYRKDLPLRYPEGTPQGLSKLGKLLKIKTDRATITPINNQTWLVRDLKGKLHIGTTSKDGLIWSGPAEDFGHVRRIEYEDVKKHLGYDRPQGFYHFMGEEDGIRPRLYADGRGGLKFKGGNYRITPEGIVN